MKNSENGPETQSFIDYALERTKMLYELGRYKESLDLCLQITNTHSNVANAWYNAAVNCVKLERWQDVIRYAETALVCGGKSVEIYDTLAYAYDTLNQRDKTRRYGLQALNARDRYFNVKPVIPWPVSESMPPLPSAQTREHNIIAFSLFGHDSKYCETAILNVQEQPRVYPHWVCRFYVDGSVPEHVINRLQAGGAQIVPVERAAAQWPGPMWRLLALNDPHAHRILFRDADSLISRREAAAVEQWLTSSKLFHMMRDNGSHTELILAGLWGVVAGSLPPLDKLMEYFMSRPLESRKTADQYFLRRYIWPYARTSLIQHDSVFGFLNAVPFPTEKMPDEHNVGYVEGGHLITFKKDLPDGSDVTWVLYRIIEKLDNKQARAELVCSYTATIHNGVVKAHIPKRYARWMQQGTAGIRLTGSGAAA